jgi:hypothetical protein
MASAVADSQGKGAPVRSNFVTVLAWIFIVLSGFAVFVSILQNVMITYLFPMERIQEVMQEQQAQQHIPGAFRFLFNNFAWFFRAFLVISLAVLAASIGLLRRKNWARIAFIMLMALGILWNLGGVALQSILLSSFPPFPHEASAEMAENFSRMLIVMKIATAFMVVAFSALFGWIIWKLVSPQIRAEFGK